MTQVINLIGGSGLGKSTTAAGLFAEMKLRGYHVELVTEYVKKWAWQGKKIDPLDQPLIFGKQAHAESILYGKADWIVTDSPLLLCALYEEFYNGKSIIKPSVLNFLEAAAEKGVKHHNFFLTRNKLFDTRGRYETEETARKVDDFMKGKLGELKIAYTAIECADRDRTPQILTSLGLAAPVEPKPDLDWKSTGIMGPVAPKWVACAKCKADVPKKPELCPECLGQAKAPLSEGWAKAEAVERDETAMRKYLHSFIKALPPNRIP